MNIKLMRFIDFWLGIPLCFILSVWGRVLEFLKLKKGRRQSEARKILFIKPSELGAIIVAYPLIKLINSKYPQAELYFLTFEKNKDVFMAMGGVIPDERVFTIREDSPRLFLMDTFSVLKRIRRLKIDMAFDLEMFSRFSAVISYLSGAVKRIGFYRFAFEGLYRGSFFTHRVTYNPLSHTSRTYLALAQAAEHAHKLTPQSDRAVDDNDIVVPKYESSFEIKKIVEERLRQHGLGTNAKLFLFNPGAGDIPIREWPMQEFIAVSRRLLEDVNRFIVVLGASENERASELFRALKESGRCVNWAGKTTILELIELFNISEALLTNDCGMAHLASLSTVRKFVIFGPESPQVFSPIGERTWNVSKGLPCSPCLSALNHRKTLCRDNKCLKFINAEEIYKLIINNL